MDDAADLVRCLLDRLDERGITWCHWKSNDMLAASASGANDLDLLVARSDASRCRALLHELGFVEAVQRPSRRLAGVLDYLGNDPALERPIHVHLHSRLVLGDDMTKNYHLPIEGPYLASVHRDGLFWVPAPELELVVFVIRMVLKHCSLDANLMLSGHLSAAELRELHHLEAAASPNEVAACVEELVPEVGADLFAACRRAIAKEVGTVQRLALGLRLERALRAYARRPVVVDVPLKSARRLYWASRRVVAPRSRRKALAHGGLVVAIVGGSPAARAQFVGRVDRWLSRDLAVLPVSYDRQPRRAARRARRFAESGGLVLTADHPARRSGPRVLGVPPPDLEIVLDGEGFASERDVRAGMVRLTADATDAELHAHVRRAVSGQL